MSRQGLWRVLAIFTLVSLVLTGCNPSKSLNALDPSGSAGEKSLNLIYLSIGIMLVVFVIVMSIFVFVLIKFRKRNGVTRDTSKYKDHSTVMEITWTLLPIAALVALAIPTVQYTFDLSEVPKNEKTVNIKVVGHQYWWEFEYKDYKFKTAQEIHIPTNTKVVFDIEGKDVLHSFWVPALGGKMDVIPNRTNRLVLDATKPGVYQGKCAELCGASHALMDFKVIADDQATFDAWVKQMTTPVTVSSDVEKKGEALFRQNCMGCHAGVNPNVQGPDLSKFGGRSTIAGILNHDEKNLKAWLKDPNSFKPGTLMPKFDYLNDEEIDALSKYLMNRK